jgi:predicted dehydrogenase
MRLSPGPAEAARPRVAFVGLGWIGRHRMAAICAGGEVEPVGIADPSEASRDAAAEIAPGAARGTTLEDALALEPDGVVIATPSALHAGQTIAALRAGCAVFCQKPLGRTGSEARAAVDAARDADRLLMVDLSYRGTEALRAIRERIGRGDLGKVFAVDLTFHNAYGPDKDWFYDKARSGGGPLMDLGVHLVDMALWCLDFPDAEVVTADIYRQGARLGCDPEVEDYACATLRLAGAVVRIACSWRLHAGGDAIIEGHFHGTEGSAAFTNPGHGFYDFAAHLHRGAAREELAAPPDAWGGRMAELWAARLRKGARFDPEAEHLVTISRLVERAYDLSR